MFVKFVCEMCLSGLQGVKSVDMVKDLVSSMVSSEKSTQDAMHSYKVHLAVVTLNLGKRLDVREGNIMARNLILALVRHGSSANILCRPFEVCACSDVFYCSRVYCMCQLHAFSDFGCVQIQNSEYVSIDHWAPVWACAKEVVKWRKGLQHLYRVPDLSKEAMPDEFCKVHLTIYNKGSVIMRWSWKNKKDANSDEEEGKYAPVWTDSVERMLINATNVLSLIIKNCC